MARPKNLTVTRYTDDVQSGRHRGVEIAEHEGAFIRELDRNPHWIGKRLMLYVPVPGERDSDGDQKYEQIEIQGAEVDVYDGGVEVAGFVHVKADGSPVRYVTDNHTGVYRREWWTQRGMR